MGDEDSFLKLVLADRTNPLPRLIYADWLDDLAEPPWTTKAAFLRLWCRLAETPLSDLDGYADLAAQLESLRAQLPEPWTHFMHSGRFQIANSEAAEARARAFLDRILPERNYELRCPLLREPGWVVRFCVLPADRLPDLRREKDHWRGGSRARKGQAAPAYESVTPLCVDVKTGRVTWHRGPALHPPAR
jgi:uncharacterized protein (TIGR02996 family)